MGWATGWAPSRVIISGHYSGGIYCMPRSSHHVKPLVKQSAFSRIGRLVCAKSPTPLEPPRGIEGSLKRPDGHRAGGPLLGRYSFSISAGQGQWDSAESQPLRFTGWWFARKSEGGTHPWLNIKKRSVPTRTNVVRTAERVVDTYLCTFYFPKLQKTRNVQ